MKRIVLLTLLLVAGLFCSQILPVVFGNYSDLAVGIRQFATMSLLAYIMIAVGREFDIDLKRKNNTS